MANAKRRNQEQHRREAVSLLANTIWAIGPKAGMTRPLAKQIAEQFVDELTEHCVSTTLAVIKRGDK